MKKKGGSWRKLNFSIKALVFVGIFCFFLGGRALPARADAWGSNVMAANMLYTLTEMSYKIKGIILSIVKNAAIQTINQQVLRLVNGTGGQGSLIIENWRDFIYTQSSKKAEDVILNDFFPKMFNGKGSGANYTPSSEGVSAAQNLASSVNTIKNYPEYLKNVGKNTVESLKTEVVKYTLDQVCSNPSDSLSKGDYRCFSEIMKPQNNRYGVPILTEKKYAEEKTKNEKIAETQAGITGYKPQTNAKGFVVTPPQTISDIVSTVQTLSAKAIAVAQNPEELITGVIQAYVNSLIQKTLSKVGLGPIGADFSRNLSDEMSRETDQLISDGVGSMFNRDGEGSNRVGPNNVGSSGAGPNPSNASSGPNWRYR